MKKKKKRFRTKGGKRSGQRDQRLSKAARELHGTDKDWTDRIESSLTSQTEDTKGRGGKAEAGGEAEPEPTWIPDGPVFQGTVVSLASAIAWVEGENSEVVQCMLPTAIAQDQRSRVAVGDRVSFAQRDRDLLVTEVLPRKTCLARPDPLNPRLQRVVAANIDVVVQVASVVRPPFRAALVDRYLVAIQYGGAEPILCVNKVDLLNDRQRKIELAPLEPYRELGLEVIECSATDGRGIEELRQNLKGKTAAFVGHSGVGKSSLINALAPSIEAATGELSEARGTGRHTTTRSCLYDLGNGIRLIDTPGIREFGLWNLDAAELREYFPDFEPFEPACRFNNCSHSHEPSCAVRQAAEAGELTPARYRTYLRILESLQG